MTCQLLTTLFLASLAQQKREWKPNPAQPAGIHVVNIGVNIMGSVEVRKIMLSMPALAEENEDQVLPHNMRFNILTSVLEPENFDRWLSGEEQSEADRRRHLVGILWSRVNAATKTHRLTDSQRAKLRLAGMGDIKRFFDQVENMRTDFEMDRHNFRAGFAALQRLNPFVQVYRDGPFGDGSLFAKSLARINRDLKVGR